MKNRNENDVDDAAIEFFAKVDYGVSDRPVWWKIGKGLMNEDGSIDLYFDLWPSIVQTIRIFERLGWGSWPELLLWRPLLLKTTGILSKDFDGLREFTFTFHERGAGRRDSRAAFRHGP